LLARFKVSVILVELIFVITMSVRQVVWL